MTLKSEAAFRLMSSLAAQLEQAEGLRVWLATFLTAQLQTSATGVANPQMMWPFVGLCRVQVMLESHHLLHLLLFLWNQSSRPEVQRISARVAQVERLCGPVDRWSRDQRAQWTSGSMVQRFSGPSECLSSGLEVESFKPLTVRLVIIIIIISWTSVVISPGKTFDRLRFVTGWNFNH